MKNYDDFKRNPFFYVPSLEELYEIRCYYSRTEKTLTAPMPAHIKDHSKKNNESYKGRIAMLKDVIGHAKGTYNYEMDGTGLKKVMKAGAVKTTSGPLKDAEKAKNLAAGIANPGKVTHGH